MWSRHSLKKGMIREKTYILIFGPERTLFELLSETVWFLTINVICVVKHIYWSAFLFATLVPCLGLGRIAGLLTLEVDNDVPPDPLHRVGSTLAMHIVAAKPLFLSKDMVSSEALESERDILKSQVIYIFFHFWCTIFFMLASHRYRFGLGYGEMCTGWTNWKISGAVVHPKNAIKKMQNPRQMQNAKK